MEDENNKGILKRIYEGTVEYSKAIVLLIIILIVIFTAAVLIIFKESCAEPTTLILAVFGFATSELAFMAAIKRKRIDKESD